MNTETKMINVCQSCMQDHLIPHKKDGTTLKHVLKNTLDNTMPVCMFVDCIKSMADEHWKYADRNKKEGIGFGKVDCVGIYRFLMYWYYEKETYGKLKASQTTVTGMYNDCTSMTGEINDNTELCVGMALFRMTENEKGELHGEHVAFYVGDSIPGYTDAVIESVKGKGVVIRSLKESEEINGKYNYYGYMEGINYNV